MLRPLAPFAGALLGIALAFSMIAQAVAEPGCPSPSMADAIVVLGAKVWPEGQPSPALRSRAESGATLWLAGKAPVLVATGGLGQWPPTEAEAIGTVARARGVPAEAIVLENESHSTEESADRVAEIARTRGWQRLIVVSDPYHLLRAGWMFRDRGFDVQTACSDESVYQQQTLRYQRARELGGLAIYSTTRGIIGRDDFVSTVLDRVPVANGVVARPGQLAVSSAGNERPPGRP